jgi:hypothetical protein
VEVKETKLILSVVYMIMSYKISYPKEENRQILQKILRRNSETKMQNVTGI